MGLLSRDDLRDFLRSKGITNEEVLLLHDSAKAIIQKAFYN